MNAAANTMAYPVNGTSALKARAVSSFELIDGGACEAHAAAKPLEPIRLFAAVAALIFAIVAVFSASMIRDIATSRQRAAAVEGIAYQEVVVYSGQGLWDIAEAHPVAGLSTAELVDHIVEVNGLPNATLHSGQRLSVPAAN